MRWPTRSRACAPGRRRASRRHHLGRRRVEARARGLGRERHRDAERRARGRASTRRRRDCSSLPRRRSTGASPRTRGRSTRTVPIAPDVALRPLEGRRRARLCARRHRRRDRAARSRTPGPGRPRRSPSRRSPAQIARIEAGQAPPSIKVGNLAARRDYSRRALRGRRLCPAARAARRAERLQRRHGQRRTACAPCSTGCSRWPRWRSRSRSIRRGCGRPTSRCSSGRPADSPRRPVGGQPGRSTKHLRTCWTPREKE